MSKLAPPQINQYRSETARYHTTESNENSQMRSNLQHSTSEADFHTPYLPTEKSKTTSKNPSFMVFHIKLDENTQKDIKCSLDDDPEVLAEKFCKENKLQKNLVPIVTKMIQTQFSKAAKGAHASVFKTSESNSLAWEPKSHRQEKSSIANLDKSEPSDTSSMSKIDGERKKKDKKPKLISKLKVNISESESRDLLLYEGEDPAEVAYRFRVENGLPPHFSQILATQLTKAEKEYYKKKEQLKIAKSGEGSRNQLEDSRREEVPQKQQQQQQFLQVPEPQRVQNKKEMFFTPQPKPVLQHQEFPTNIKGKKLQIWDEPPKEAQKVVKREEYVEEQKSYKREEIQKPYEFVREKQVSSEDGNQVENTYEKWQHLINEKRKNQPQQHSPEHQSTRSQTPKMKRESNQNYQQAMRSLTPTSKMQSAAVKEEKLERTPPRKVDKTKADEIVNRLYSDSQRKSDTLVGSQSDNKEKKPKSKYAVFNYKPRKPKAKVPNIWGEELIEGYEPSPRKAKELIRQEKERKERFPYTPYISEHSRMLAEKRNRSASPIHHQLHAEAHKIMEKRRMLGKLGIEEQCTFQPNADRWTQGENSDRDFMKRLADREVSRQRYEAEEEEKRRVEEATSPIDPVTGQKLFTPQIKKGKYYQLVQKREYFKIKQALKEKAEEEAQRREKKETKETDRSLSQGRSMYSERPVEKSREMRPKRKGDPVLMSIFDQLDSDGDGFISEREIDISELDPTTLEALIHILDIIEERKLRLDFDGFVRLIREELGQEEIENLNAQHNARGHNYSSRSRDEVVRERNHGDHSHHSGRHEEPERVNMKNLGRHYQKLLGKK